MLPGKHTGIVVFTTIVLYRVLRGESDAAGGIFSSSRGLGYNPRGAGRHDYVEPDCALRNHYTTCAEGKAPPKAAFSPQAVGCRYNPREAGRHDVIVPDCALRNHYTVNASSFSTVSDKI